MRTLTIVHDITAGDTTCADGTVRGLSGHPVMCRFAEPEISGAASCWLFGQRLRDVEGWLQRLPECIAAERRTGGRQ